MLYTHSSYTVAMIVWCSYVIMQNLYKTKVTEPCQVIASYSQCMNGNIIAIVLATYTVLCLTRILAIHAVPSFFMYVAILLYN